MMYEKKITSSKYLNAALTSIKAASVGLIFAVALSIMFATTTDASDFYIWQTFNFDWLSLVIMTAGFILHIRYEINPVIITVIAGLIGWVIYFV